MKLGLPEHTCKFFTSPHRSRRYCKQCHQVQYNYTGSWEDEITFARFVGKHIEAMGNGKPDIRIEIGTAFEYDCYESWGTFYDISIRKGEEWIHIGRAPNLNYADNLVQKTLDKQEKSDTH